MMPGCISVVLIFIISAMGKTICYYQLVLTWVCGCIGLAYVGVAKRCYPSENSLSLSSSQMKSLLSVIMRFVKEYENSTIEQADMDKCYGCGCCAGICKHEAIIMKIDP